MARFGVKEVADVTFYSLVTGEPDLYLDTLKLSNLENTAESTYATGGKGASRLVGWDFGRTSTFNIQDALLNPKALAMQLGTDLEKKVETIHAREVLVAERNATGTYTVQLKEKIKGSGSSFVAPFVYITDVNGNAQLAKVDVKGATYDTPTIEIKGDDGELKNHPVTEITLLGIDVEDALNFAKIAKTPIQDKVSVIVYYQFETTEVAETITVSSDKYAGYYKVIGDTLWRNEATGQDEKVQLVIPKAKITSTFTMTMQPDGDPSVFDFNLDVFKDTASTDMVKMVRYKSNYEA